MLTIEFVSSPSWIDAVVTLLAVLLGAGLSYFTTRFFERRREKSELRVNAIKLFLKLHELVNGVLVLERQIKAGVDRAKKAGVEGPAWTQMEEISSIDDYQVEISTEELSVLALKEEYDLIQKIVELRDGYNSLVRALGLIFKLRNELGDQIGPKMDGQVASFEVDLEKMPHIGPRLVNLTTLSNNTVELLTNLIPEAKKVAKEYSSKIKTHFSGKNFPTMLVDEAGSDSE